MLKRAGVRLLGSISKLWQAWDWAAGDVTKPECGSACQGAPAGWQTWCHCQGTSQQPREGLITAVGLQRQPAGTMGTACGGHGDSVLESTAQQSAAGRGARPAERKSGAALLPARALAPGSGSPEPPGTADGSSTFATLPAPASPWLPELRG